MGFNYRMHPILIGILSIFVLFGAGYLASLILGGPRPDMSALTIWRSRKTDETASRLENMDAPDRVGVKG